MYMLISIGAKADINSFQCISGNTVEAILAVQVDEYVIMNLSKTLITCKYEKYIMHPGWKYI
jgi:hypothetical protein